MFLANAWSEIWNGILAGLNFLLQALYSLTGNYGLAIILLTVLIKVILLPLTIKQTKSMIAMQKIQPEIKKLQEKYKDDKEKLSQEMMKFYKEHNVSLFSGCLPLLLQLPVFFALYIVIRKYLLTPPTLLLGNTLTVLPGYTGGVALKSAGFLWMESLADTTRIADPTFILVILLAASTWYSQKQIMTDPRQKNMMIIMPLVSAFIGLSLPAGVVLYWVVTNVLQILQQFGMEAYEKRHPSKEEPKKKPAKAGSAASGKTAGARHGGKKRPSAAPGKSAAGVGAKKRPSQAGGGKKAGGGRTQAGGKKKPGDGQVKGKQTTKKQLKGKSQAKKKQAATQGEKASSSKSEKQVRRPKNPPPGSKGAAGKSGKGGSKKKEKT
jgi:YidC/Oxa1 family membrane protein insertase